MKKKTIHILNAIVWGLIVLGALYWMLVAKNKERDYFEVHPRSAENEANVQNAEQNDQKEDSAQSNQTTEKPEVKEEPPGSLGPLPQKVLNEAPFAEQAPFKVWDDLHDEACEEAAIITAHYYLAGKAKLSKQEVEDDIRAMVGYQLKNYGSHKDLTAAEMVRLAADYYGDNYELVTGYVLDDLKRYLADGAIIITPAAGRVLNNPNFRQPGPLYHALVLIGYDEKNQQFITNDPGTRKGAGFRYSYSNLLNSIHDFPGKKENILQGRKVVIIVKKK